ncbi:MAG TPA: HAD family hydrolase [Gemmatimonadaceae bacterium]|nr:HAD family hydrolase [Gemmatimonadaceae bacterium]
MSGPDIAFLDRDGTIIRDVKYISDPDAVELIDGAAAAIGRLNEAGIPVVIVSNQSGIGRGYYDVEDYERVHARMLDLLAASGAHIDASYYCPHAPDRVPPCECRKPRAGLFEKALAAAGADARKAWYVGDRLRDIAPALVLGGQGVLLVGEDTPANEAAEAELEARTARTLAEAVDLILVTGRPG